MWGLLSLEISHIFRGNPKAILEPGWRCCHPTRRWTCAAAGMGMHGNAWNVWKTGGKQHERAQAPSEGGMGAVFTPALGFQFIIQCLHEMSQGYKCTIKCAVTFLWHWPCMMESISILWNSLAFQSRMDASHVLLGNVLWAPQWLVGAWDFSRESWPKPCQALF